MEKTFLDPREVDLEDRTYWVPNFADPGPLRKSVEAVGILNPPVIQTRGNALIPLLGRRRLQAAVELGIPRVDVRLVSPDMPETDGFLLAFWDNAGHRVWDSATKAVVVRRLLELLPRETVAREMLSGLSIPARGPILERLKRIGGLECRFLAMLATGQLQEKTAALLADMATEERLTLLNLIERLGMNANKNAEIVQDLFDLSVFQTMPISELLAEDPFASLVADDKVMRPEMARRFRELVRSRKYPEMARQEEEFLRWSLYLQLTENVNVRHTPAFENEDCIIEIRTRSSEEAERIIDRLREEP
jgi:ParB family transcriptional regulator, chromosome partitioning protein